MVHDIWIVSNLCAKHGTSGLLIDNVLKLNRILYFRTADIFQSPHGRGKRVEKRGKKVVNCFHISPY